jgi:redox-regulated HSP33 family molecular chaperone
MSDIKHDILMKLETLKKPLTEKKPNSASLERVYNLVQEATAILDPWIVRHECKCGKKKPLCNFGVLVPAYCGQCGTKWLEPHEILI